MRFQDHSLARVGEPGRIGVAAGAVADQSST